MTVDIASVHDHACTLTRRELSARFPADFASLHSYGATHLDPAHLVVWVLLTGEPQEIPEWYFPGQTDAAPVPSPALQTVIDAMHLIVIGAFRTAGWPGQPRVGFDAADRVAAQGGWHYFV